MCGWVCVSQKLNNTPQSQMAHIPMFTSKIIYLHCEDAAFWPVAFAHYLHLLMALKEWSSAALQQSIILCVSFGNQYRFQYPAGVYFKNPTHGKVEVLKLFLQK